MGDPLSDATPGRASPFVVRADTVNLTLDAVRRFRRQQLGSSGGPADAPPVVPANLVWVRNDTGATLPVFSAVRPLAALIDPTADTDTALSARQQPAFSGGAFAAVTDPVLVTIEPADVGGWVRAVADGVGVAQVVVNALTDGYAQPVVGQTYLESVQAAGPVRLVLAPVATGGQNAYVQLGLPAGVGGWFARLTTASSGKWKWVPQTLDDTGAWIDNGSESASYNAVPSPIDGSTTVTPTAGLRVWMIPSLQPGYFEFRPDPAGGSAVSVLTSTLSSPPLALTSSSFTATGLSITVPSAGTYMVIMQATGEVAASGGPSAIYCRLYLNGDVTGVSPGQYMTVAYSQVASVADSNTACSSWVQTFAAGDVVEVYAVRTGSGTFSVSGLYNSNPAGDTFLQLIKLA